MPLEKKNKGEEGLVRITYHVTDVTDCGQFH